MTPHSPPAIPALIDQLIGRYRFRKTMLCLGAWIGAGLTGGLFLFAVALVADRFLDMPGWVRAGISVTTVAVPAILIAMGLISIFFRQTDEALAGELDEAVSGSRDLLRSSVNLSSRKADASAEGAAKADRPFMLEQMLEQAQTFGRSVQPGRVLGWNKVPAAFGGTVFLFPVVIGIFVSPVMDAPLLLQRFLHPLGNFPRPSWIKIAVDQGDIVAIQQGDDLLIHATLSGRIPADVRTTLELVPASANASAQKQTILMTPRPGNQFESALKNVVEPATFTIAAADGRSERHSIAVQPRPMISNLTSQYIYPRYTQLPQKTEPVSIREFKGVEGTRVRIDFESSIPVNPDFCKVVFPDSQLAIRWDKARTKGTFQFTIDKETSFQVQLVAESGADNRNEAPFRVRLLPDNPPTVSLLGIPENLSMYRDDLLNLSYKGTDDFGISEVFIRYHQATDPRTAKEFTLKSVMGVSKEVAGDFSMAIRDITGPDDTYVDIELVMVDSKGQEGVSPSVRLSVISNTPDRQLSELLTFQDRYIATIARSVTNLKYMDTRLTVLLDGMDDATVLKDTRKNIWDEINHTATDIRFPFAVEEMGYSIMLFSEYPYICERRTQEIFARFAAIPGFGSMSPLLDSISRQATPRQDLLKLKARVAALAPVASDMQSYLLDLNSQTRLTLISYLAWQYVEEASVATTAGGVSAGTSNAGTRSDGPSAEALALVAEKQEGRIRLILSQLDLIKVSDDQAALRDAVQGVQKAAALSADTRGKALVGAMGDLRKQLDTGTCLDGHMAAPLESYLRQTPWAMLLQRAAGDQSLPLADRAIGSWIRFRRSGFIGEGSEIFLNSSLQQALHTTDQARTNQVLSAAAALRDWSRKSDLLDRAQLLRRSLANIDIEIRTGRLNPKTPAFDQSWQLCRELMLSICDDATAGRFTGLSGDLDSTLQALTLRRADFASWSGREATGASTWMGAKADAVHSLDRLIAILLPDVRSGRKQAIQMVGPMMNDMATNIAALKPKVDQELVDIKADIDAAKLQPVSMNNTLNNGKVQGRMANPPRIAFARALSEDFTGFAVAIGAILELKESDWASQPVREGLPEFQDMAVLYEYLSHLDQEVYDKVYAIHLQQVFGARSYPANLEATVPYLSGMESADNAIVSALGMLAGGQASKLAANPDFAQIPIRINKHQRFDSEMRSINQQLEFAESGVANRKAILLALSRDPITPTAYWDRVYLATRMLLERVATKVPAGDAGSWTGVDDATLASWLDAMARLNAILPDVADGGDDVKILRQSFEDFVAVSPHVAAGRVAKLDGTGRGAARDELEEWRGKLEGAMRTLEGRLALPAVKSRPSARLLVMRYDLMNIVSRIIQNESIWGGRNADAVRQTASTRAQLMVPADSDPPATSEDLSYDFVREGTIRRRSAAVTAQASRGLDIGATGPDEKFLKMPKYLYNELRKTAKKPYPTQFKDTALNYTQDLMKDAR